MLIYGNQTAIKEIMNLLDPLFVPSFMCRCYGRQPSNIYAVDQGLGRTHWCECLEQDFWFEENYRCYFHIYDVDYNGENILKCKELSSSDNLLTGCLK